MEKLVFRKDDEVGVTWFIPDSEFVEGKPCTGVIREKYQEGSVYEGHGEYDGKDFYRQGYGIQDFSGSIIKGESMGGPMDSVVYKYVGNYDRHMSGWLYGNGILYFKDKQGKPLTFFKGFFENSSTLVDWHGEFDPDLLMKGYTPDMEGKLVPFAGYYDKLVAETKDIKDVDYVFFGDSWVEFWRNPEYDPKNLGFNDEVKLYGLNALNVGIGGTRYCDWIKFLDELVIKHNPKAVFINLGFNDLHSNFASERVFEQFKQVVNILRSALKDVKIYVNAVCHTSPFTQYFEKETALNKMVEDYANSTDYITYIPVNLLFMKDGKMIENMDYYCIADHFHLKRVGYDIWAKKILETIKNG